MNKILFENIVHSWVDKFVIFEDERYITNDETKYAQQEVFNRIMELFDSNEQEVNSIADEIGINLRYNKKNEKGEKKYPVRKTDRKNFLNKYSTTIGKKEKRDLYDFTNYENIAKEITNKILQISNLLKKGGYVDDESRFLVTKLKKDRPNDYRQILRMKDFIDRWGLTFLYDNNKDFGINKTENRFGITFNDDNSFNLNNFSIDNISDAQIKSWVKGNENRNNIGDERLQRFALLQNIIDSYFETKYGIMMKVEDMPKFSVGNNKVQNALMVNFVSAHRCPAWNSCLVKHACYAKADEMQHQNSKQSNDKKNLMWLLADKDEKLMDLMYMQLRSFAIDYKGVCKYLNIDYSNFKDILKRSFSDLNENNPEIIEAIKKNKRVPYIRLNENGDFLSSSFLEKIDEIAGEFKLIGITTAAYTCRNFANYQTIKNIIINASRDYINSGSGNTIARYFVAIPEKLFKLYEETYVEGNSKDFVVVDGKVTHNPLPLYDVRSETPNGNYYFKCPCGRTDFKTINEAKKSTNTKPKINCYQCNLCYQPKNLNIEGKYYVFVTAHGSTKNVLNNENYVISHIGVSERMIKNKFKTVKRTDGSNDYHDVTKIAAKQSPNNLTVDDKLFEESFNIENNSIIQNMEKEAFETIGANAVGSMNERIKEITRINEIKEDFFNKLNTLD